MPFENPHHDSKTKAVAAGFSVSAGIQAGERFENPLAVRFPDTHAVIVEMDDALSAVTLDNNLDSAIGMAKCIPDEVAECPGQIFWLEPGFSRLFVKIVVYRSWSRPVSPLSSMATIKPCFAR
jgi:hypothetical protein